MKINWAAKILGSSILALAGLTILLSGPARAATWSIQLVDSRGTGKSSSMRVDKDGNVHIAYVIEDGNRFPLIYGYWDHVLKRWFFMPVAEGAATCSLTLDSQQRPHISYVDYGTGSGSKLRYAHWDGSVWQKEIVPLNADVIAFYSSIVLDANDLPTLSFYEYRGPKDSEFKIRMRTVAYNGQRWEARTIDGQEGSGKFNSMAVDAQGRIHLAYANVASGTAGLRYACWDGKSWTTEIVDDATRNNGDSVGYSAAIAVDKEGNPHIAYMNESNPALKYAFRRNGQWVTQTIDRIGGVGYPDRNSIALTEDGQPYISYYDAGRSVLKLVYRDGARWLSEAIDSNAGFNSSVQIYKGQIWVSYADELSGGLKVARADLPKAEAKGPEVPKPPVHSQN